MLSCVIDVKRGSKIAGKQLWYGAPQSLRFGLFVVGATSCYSIVIDYILLISSFYCTSTTYSNTTVSY